MKIMTTTTHKAVNGNSNNGMLGKRKKSRENRGTYLNKWLDKTMQHIQESTPSMDTYESYAGSNGHPWMPNTNPFVANTDGTCRYTGNYGCPPEPMSLPAYTSYCPPNSFNPFANNQYWGMDYINRFRPEQAVNKGIQVQRPRQKRQSQHNKKKVSEIVNSTFRDNGFLNGSYLQPPTSFNTTNNDFASLPPIVTSIPDSASNSNTNETKDDSSNNRRYSDPCLPRPDVTELRNEEEQNETESESSSVPDTAEISNKLFMCLADEINALKVRNERLNKDLQETRSELHTMKQQTSMWLKDASSLGVQGHATNLQQNNGLITSTMSYSPGMITDVVREIREAARIREEALYARVRSMIEERSFNTSAHNNSLDKTVIENKSVEDLKGQLRTVESDRRRMNDRLVKLEEELHTMRTNQSVDELSSMSSCGTPEWRGGSGGGVGEDRLQRRLNEERARRRTAEEKTLKMEKLVTQMLSKFNGLNLSTSTLAEGARGLSHEPTLGQGPVQDVARGTAHPEAPPRRANPGPAVPSGPVTPPAPPTLGHNGVITFGPVTDL